MKKRYLLPLIAVLMIFSTCTVFAGAEGTPVFTDKFETANAQNLPVNWLYDSYEATYNGNSGNASAELVYDNERGGNVLYVSAVSDDDVAVYQEIAVSPSSVYSITCYIKTKGVSGSGSEVAGANIGLRGDLIVRSDALVGDNEWQQVELVGRTSSDQTSITLSCRVGGYSATSRGEAWFDDIEIRRLDGYSGDSVNFYSKASTNNTTDEEPNALKTIVIIAIVLLVIGAVITYIIVSKKKKEFKSSTKNDSKNIGYNEKNDSHVKLESELKGTSFFDVSVMKIPEPTDTKLHFKKLDWIFILALTAVYSFVALFKLGTTIFPENYWKGRVNDTVRIEFGGEYRVKEVMQNSGIAQGEYTITDDSGEIITHEMKYGEMFRWRDIGDFNKVTTGVTVTVTSGTIWLNELVFVDQDENIIPCTVSDNAYYALVDESDTTPKYTGYYNGMYFDELYHGRTAYEHLNNMSVYEWTHPPLGKLIIAIGISIFGMNPFGWRIMGTLFGIAMVPIMYCFGKRFFKRSTLALLTAALFAFDFMHFTQTRIATVDVYGVFFILLMTYFMYKYLCMDIGDSVKKTLVPLALSGLFFGLGCASKWICMYTGVALAVMLFTKLTLMGVKSYKLQRNAKGKEFADLVKNYWKRVTVTCLACVGFFVIIPLIIYCGSYFRYYTAEWEPDAKVLALNEAYASGEYVYGVNDATIDDIELSFEQKVSTYIKGVWKNQEDMYGYHSGLGAEHSAASPWWAWIFNLRPVWYHLSSDTPVAGTASTISAFGNPAVWNVCFVGTVALAVLLLRRKLRVSTEVFTALICMGSSLLPWVFVTRSTYAYHYFATVPFIILASVYLLKYIEDRFSNGLKPFAPYIKWIWLGVALLLFVMFYPVISGRYVSTEYITALQWVPFYKFEMDGVTYRIGWTFMGYGD